MCNQTVSLSTESEEILQKEAKVEGQSEQQISFSDVLGLSYFYLQK